MNKSEANLLLANQLVSGLAEAMHDSLEAANNLYANAIGYLSQQFDIEEFNRLYADLCSDAVHLTLSRTDWSSYGYTANLQKRGAYPRAELTNGTIRIVSLSDKPKSKYIMEAIKLNAPGGLEGARCLLLTYSIDCRQGVVSAALSVPRGDNKGTLAQVNIFPEIDPNGFRA